MLFPYQRSSGKYEKDDAERIFESLDESENEFGDGVRRRLLEKDATRKYARATQAQPPTKEALADSMQEQSQKGWQSGWKKIKCRVAARELETMTASESERGLTSSLYGWFAALIVRGVLQGVYAGRAVQAKSPPESGDSQELIDDA